MKDDIFIQENRDEANKRREEENKNLENQSFFDGMRPTVLKTKTKASELVKMLQEAIDKYGDLPVFQSICTDDNYGEWEIRYVEGAELYIEDGTNEFTIVWAPFEEKINSEDEL